MFDINKFREAKKRPQSVGENWETTPDELNAAYQAGERDFSYVRVRNADFYQINLSGSNFRGCDFRECNFSEANLEGCNFVDACLRYAKFTYANLKHADLSFADLFRAMLTNTKLDEASLKCAELRMVNLGDASLRGANMYRADLENAHLEFADATNANLEQANLRGASFNGIDLYNANLHLTIGVYSVFAIGMSSRTDILYAAILVGDEIKLRFWVGCKSGISPDSLRQYIKMTHQENSHALQYTAAIEFIERCFQIDLANGRWDYLRNWGKDK